MSRADILFFRSATYSFHFTQFVKFWPLSSTRIAYAAAATAIYARCNKSRDPAVGALVFLEEGNIFPTHCTAR